MKSLDIFRYITRAENGVWVVLVLFVIGYIILPLYLRYGMHYVDPAYMTLALLATVGLVCILGARFLPLPKLPQMQKVPIDRGVFLAVLWVVFIGFAIVAWATAPEVPIIAELRGAAPPEVAELREEFLKGRGGWESSFVYINAVLSVVLIPYSIALMFLVRSKFRWICLAFFLGYCLSYAEKAVFLRAVVPVFYLVSRRQLKMVLSPWLLTAASAALLVGLTALTMSGSGGGAGWSGDYFSDSYRSTGPIDQFLWRTFSVPLFTAIDAIKVYETSFGKPLMGATSAFLAFITGAPRISFERLVFAYEWGQSSTGTGSANSVYLTEAYVNFEWVGVCLFSLVVGLALRLFARSKDEALRSLWLLFVISIYTAGLIGTLLSEGFLLLFALSAFVRLEERRAPVRSRRTQSLAPSA